MGSKNNRVKLVGVVTLPPQRFKDQDYYSCFTLAVDRPDSGRDYLLIVCGGVQKRFVEEHIRKGSEVTVQGELRSYGDKINVLATQIEIKQ